MNSIIHDLFYGNISSEMVIGCSCHSEIDKEVDVKRELLRSKLSPEYQAEVERFKNLVTQQATQTDIEYFSYGIKIGARFIAGIFDADLGFSSCKRSEFLKTDTKLSDEMIVKTERMQEEEKNSYSHAKLDIIMENLNKVMAKLGRAGEK